MELRDAESGLYMVNVILMMVIMVIDGDGDGDGDGDDDDDDLNDTAQHFTQLAPSEF